MVEPLQVVLYEILRLAGQCNLFFNVQNKQPLLLLDACTH